jgi:hypothetical protein
MAPNTTGHRQTDHLRIIGLIEAAADFAIEAEARRRLRHQGLPGRRDGGGAGQR